MKIHIITKGYFFRKVEIHVIEGSLTTDGNESNLSFSYFLKNCLKRRDKTMKGGIEMKKVRLMTLTMILALGITIGFGAITPTSQVLAQDPGYGDID